MALVRDRHLGQLPNRKVAAHRFPEVFALQNFDGSGIGIHNGHELVSFTGQCRRKPDDDHHRPGLDLPR